MTGIKEGECRVTLTLSKTGYKDKVIEYVIPVIHLPVNDFKGKHLFNGLVLGSSYTIPIFADLDGDGDRDLVVGNRGWNFDDTIEKIPPMHQLYLLN